MKTLKVVTIVFLFPVMLTLIIHVMLLNVELQNKVEAQAKELAERRELYRDLTEQFVSRMEAAATRTNVVTVTNQVVVVELKPGANSFTFTTNLNLGGISQLRLLEIK